MRILFLLILFLNLSYADEFKKSIFIDSTSKFFDISNIDLPIYLKDKTHSYFNEFIKPAGFNGKFNFKIIDFKKVEEKNKNKANISIIIDVETSLEKESSNTKYIFTVSENGSISGYYSISDYENFLNSMYDNIVDNLFIKIDKSYP